MKKDKLHYVIPLSYIINVIEENNFNYIINNKEIDFLNESVVAYDEDIGKNPFWFAGFLIQVLELP
jgi:Fe-S cluster assembly iron-binding protein IscA